MNYQFPAGPRTITTKGIKKADVQHLAYEVKNAVHVQKHFIEICGTIGGEEHRSMLMDMFCVHPHAPRPGYQEALDIFVQALPDPVTPATIKQVSADARAIVSNYAEIIDKRTTPAQNEARDAERAKISEAMQAQGFAFIDKYCESRTTVKVPDDKMAIVAELTYDDSDMMTDYYHPYAQHGVDMLLGIVNKGARTETVARKILALYPELEAHTWTWHTENYSGGHGNFLLSEYCDEAPDIHAYDGRKGVRLRYRITFGAWHKEAHPIKGYPGIQQTAATTTNTIQTAAACVSHNTEHNGVEVRFPVKPDQSIIDTLKAKGFRWSGRSGLWYNRYTDNLWQWALDTFTAHADTVAA